jgi:heme-degrading monooxygenase HmoA
MVRKIGGLILAVIYIVWEFRVKKNKRKPFETYYRSNGKWAEMFRQSEAYQESVLIHDSENAERYLVVDIWKDIDSFRSFKRKFGEEYAILDTKCEAFTDEERCLGFFSVCD